LAQKKIQQLIIISKPNKMMSNSEFGSISFDLPKPIKCNQSGVGGGSKTL
jgi:hypothetical protein